MALSNKTGLRINYRSSVPWMEVAAKEIKFAVQDFVFWIANGFKLPVVVAYPDFPSKRTTLYKIVKGQKMRLTNKLLVEPVCVVYFEDSTFGTSTELRNKYPTQKILNEACTDISKYHVDALHKQVFGYSTIIDPMQYSGWVVEKSDLNAMHDGRLVQCPTAKSDEQAVYQILLNNQVAEDLVMDYRVPVVGNTIPLVYKKYKKVEVRFTNEVFKSELSDTAELFSMEEQQLLLQYAKTLGADFCEFDVIRNMDDQRIYIIDVNKTPYGPPARLPEQEVKKAVSLLKTAFKKEFL